MYWYQFTTAATVGTCGAFDGTAREDVQPDRRARSSSDPWRRRRGGGGGGAPTTDIYSGAGGLERGA